MTEKANTRIVSKQLSKWRISFGMAISVFIIALRLYPPVKAIKVMAQINRRKQIVQGIRGIPKFFKSRNRIFIELHTPGWPSPAFNNFFSTELQKNISGLADTGKIQNAIFSITNKCSLNCQHCFEWDNLGETEILSTDNLRSISTSLQKAGASIIQISGGEPLERFADCCLLARESSAQTDFWLLTSGFGLDRFKTEILKYSGYSGINIGLDHWDADKHNAFRGNDQSFRWAVEAAKNTNKAGLMVALSLCAMRDFVSKENLDKYLELARDIGASFIQILEPREAGRFKGRDISLKAHDRQVISNFYLSVNNNPEYRDYPSIVYHGNYQRSHGCLGAASRYLYIDSHGNAHACPFCQDPLGNILKSSLDEIIIKTKMRGCHLFREYRDDKGPHSLYKL